MIQRIRLVPILITTILLISFTAAWPWPPSIENIEGLIFRRQTDSNNAKESDSSSLQPTKTQASESNTSSDNNSQDPKSTATSGSTGKHSQTTGSSKTTSKSAKTSAIDERLPAGGVAMITPAPIAPAEYYKIGDNIEFAWNYTSLLADPKAIDIFVSCDANKATYPISNNATFEPTGRVVWNTSADETGSAPLLTETYTLVIHDVDEDVTAVPQAGHLAVYNQFHFGMYLRQTYVPRDKWVCATCSGALSDMERQTLKFVFGMCAITVLSFTWFAGGCGVLF